MQPLLQIPGQSFPTGTLGLVLHRALLFGLRSLVTMDTVEEAPLPAEANGWHSGNEREGTGDLAPVPVLPSTCRRALREVFPLNLHLNPSTATD